MGSKIVMVIDDVPLNIDEIEFLLKPLNINVVESAGRKEALVKLKKGEELPDLIVADLFMPHDGLETGVSLIEQIKKEPKTKDIPIIVFSLFARYVEDPDNYEKEPLPRYKSRGDYLKRELEKFHKRLIDAGVEVFIQKDFHPPPEELVRKIKEKLGINSKRSSGK